MATETVPRVGVCGLGSVGRRVAELLLDYRRGLNLVAAATLETAVVGRPVHEVVGARNPGPTVVASLAELLQARPDIVVLCTSTFLADTVDDILACAHAGAAVISPCEELAFPFTRHPDLASRIDEAARASGVAVLGSGVNPGFMFDSLLLAATGVCWDITAIRGTRVVDISGFGQTIHDRLGIGVTPERFESGHTDGSIAGHVGFRESIEMVCERLGLPLDGPVEQTFTPLLAATGLTEGLIQRATGLVDGEAHVQLDLILHLRPEPAGYHPTDHIEIDGKHPLRLTLDPGMDSILATSAMLVNGIPVVLSAAPGLHTVKDLPATTAWLSDLSEIVSR